MHVKKQHRKQDFPLCYIMAAFWTQTRTSRPSRARKEKRAREQRETLRNRCTLIFWERNNQPRSPFRATRPSL